MHYPIRCTVSKYLYRDAPVLTVQTFPKPRIHNAYAAAAATAPPTMPAYLAVAAGAALLVPLEDGTELAPLCILMEEVALELDGAVIDIASPDFVAVS